VKEFRLQYGKIGLFTDTRQLGIPVTWIFTTEDPFTWPCRIPRLATYGCICLRREWWNRHCYGTISSGAVLFFCRLRTELNKH